jgi:hypothetical protein
MKLFSNVILAIASIEVFVLIPGGLAQTNAESVETFLPKGTVTDALYVQIQDDPALSDYGRRIREAREKNPEWFFDYAKKHQTPDSAPLPYHTNFGVSKEEYEHFIQPMNHFRETKRQEIKIRRSSQNGRTQLGFQGKDLLLTSLELDVEAGTAKTALDVLPRQSFVDLQTASLPPGRHRGVLFTTPQAKIMANKRRESLLIGELKDQNSGIIHYSINATGEVKMIYIQFPK